MFDVDFSRGGGGGGGCCCSIHSVIKGEVYCVLKPN